ncbi:hypothetical protein ACFVP0_33665 [Streptomyces cinereoruber]|uniref:hypothetical protein n=1 Tax=Streptomyces cinereoruber TaxID=67260 RepID=UPI0036B5CA70
MKLEIVRDSTYYEGREIHLPFDSYDLSRNQREEFRKAIYEVSNKCMKSYGLEWPEATHAGTIGTDNSRRYGVINLLQAKEFGYGVPLPDGITIQEAQKIAESNVERTRNLPQEVRDVYTGEGGMDFNGKAIPDGGCRGRAYAELGLPVSGIESTALDAMRNETWSRARTSSIVIDAVNKWRACMKEAGYNYKTPEDAVGAPSWQRNGAPSKAEINAATTDISCKRKVMLVEKWHAVETESQREMLQEKSDLLDGLKRDLDLLVQNIARVRSSS